MFRFLTISLVVLVAWFSTINIEASAATSVGKDLYLKNNVTVIINGEKVTFDDPILNKSGSLLLPMRDFYEAIGAKVYWNQQTKTASSERNGHTVDLTINSKKAKVNGKVVSVNIAPLLYKYSTYVPLRFVIENFDGKVTWDQKNQKVEIDLDGSTEGPVLPPDNATYILHMNNSKIIMDEPIVNKQGRLYIPAKYFKDYLEDSYSVWQSDKVLELQIAGLNFVFTSGSNTVSVNGQPVTINEIPFIQSGEMYVPVHFIVNAFGNGGNVRYISESKELYIYLFDYMFTSNFLEKSTGSLMVPTLVQNASLEGNRDLLVSDNPETLTPELVPGDTATLAKYDVQSGYSTKEHRVFGWHFNNMGTKVTLGITIQNTSNNSLEVLNSKDVKRISGNSWLEYDIGLPIADAVLNNKMENSSSSGIVIAPGETKIIETYELDPKKIVGFLHDFDIKTINGSNSTYTIRTVMSKNGEDLSLIHSDPVPIDQAAQHPRGTWPSSTIVANLPTYFVDSPEVGYNISNGKTDHFLTAENSLSTINGAVGNPGHFGMTYKVNIPIINQTGSAKVVKVKLAGRGGLYSGAVKMNGQVHLVPTLKPGSEYVELPEYTVTNLSDTINLEIMHSGGSNLPVAIYIETKY